MKYIKKHLKINNRGSAAIEATLVLPFFIVGMVAVYHMAMLSIAEASVYEAAVETLEYMSEYAYIDEHGSLLPSVLLPKYVDDEELVKQYIVGGADGVSFFGTKTLTEDDIVELHVQYSVAFSVPFLQSFSGNRSFVLRQRAYTGAEVDKEDNDKSEERYVYVTDNREVYHSSRSCTYLTLSIQISNLDKAVKAGYEPCDFCGDDSGSAVYITDYGNKYHSNIHCSGLKRTVTRVKLSEIGGIPGCARCVKN